jgi:hypothetical protein
MQDAPISFRASCFAAQQILWNGYILPRIGLPMQVTCFTISDLVPGPLWGAGTFFG